MKFVFPIIGLTALTACMTPLPSPEEVIPFSQVLAETEGRPYECSEYDAATDTCDAITTTQITGPGRYFSRTTFFVDPSLPALEGALALYDRGDAVCGNMANSELSFSGDVGFAQELMLASIESEFATLGEICVVYTKTENGYRTQVISGPDLAFEDPIDDYQFFASPKPLRIGQ
ncbi:hypothetical protein L0666_09890 [Octadecabacter sp. CECT 8868]|uniref:hypothetical protein n=1 Tax=Octadecabacter algicola TaxID=2909342 RepID=UPI001F215DF7|nr:hypothetical protein [Octadecabacter algicola]MCF2905301.1 hypothetical protein [Octadecabacter algicola]